MLHRQITRFSRCQDKLKKLLPSVTFESCVIINRHVMDKFQGFLDAKINPLDITAVFPRNYVTINVMLHRQITRFSQCQDKPKMLLPSVTFESCVIINRHVMDKLQGFLDGKINPLDIYRGLSSKLRHDQRNVTSTNYKVFSMPR